MSENTVNRSLRLSSEVGYEDKNREDQIYGRDAYDWRDWLNHLEFESLSDVEGMALAKSRFNDIAAAADVMAALIEFKLTVMKVRVSHDQPYSAD
jgi:hypothetical protein